MNVVLYLSVVLIWGTTWLAIFLQQDAAATPVYVAVFWRFLFASLLMLALLTLCRRLRQRSSVLSAAGRLCFWLQLCLLLSCGGLDQHRSGVGDFFHGGDL